MISTQTPTLVFDPDGRLVMILGSPGGGRIPNILTQVISNVIDHGMSFLKQSWRQELIKGWKENFN